MVSGTKNPQRPITKLKDPKMKYVPNGVEYNITGVALETTRLWTQWVSDARATL